MRVACWLLAASLWAGAAAAKPKKKAPAPSAEAAIRQALDGRAGAIAECAASALTGGVTAVEVSARVTLDSGGQVLACEVTVTPEVSTAAATRACVERAVRAAAFPRSGAPLTTAQRTWKFSAE